MNELGSGHSQDSLRPHHPWISLSHFLGHWVPKVQRRLPRKLQGQQFWTVLTEDLYAKGVLSSAQSLHQAKKQCGNPSDLFDFASRVFPAHQQRKEILGFADLASTLSPKVVVEIGTAESGTQFLLGETLTSAELSLALDLRVRNRKLLGEFTRKGLNRIIIEGSSYEPGTVNRVATVLANQKIDVLFIDGDHTYAGVRADYEAYKGFVRNGGLIAFHDIIEDHHSKYGTPTAGWSGGVPKFWQEVKSQQGSKRCWEFIADPQQDGMGIGVLEV
jgi:cephalosporin hydroxylase